MGTIRKVISSDYGFILNSIESYKPSFYGIHKYALDVIMLNKYSSCLIYENDNNEIVSFDVNIFEPKTFWEAVYKNISFFKSLSLNFKFALKQTKRMDIKDNSEIDDISKHLYSKNGNHAVTLFYYNMDKSFSANTLGIYNMKLLNSNFKYQTAQINKNNIASQKSYKKRGFNTTSFFQVEEDILLAVIELPDIKEQLNEYKTQYNVEI